MTVVDAPYPLVTGSIHDIMALESAMHQSHLHRLEGVFAPVLTPFDSKLAPNNKAFIEHCRWLTDGGVGLAMFGTNSEANSLSVSERLLLMDALLEAGLDPARMMPGTGCSSLTDTVTLTRNAVSSGVSGVLVLPPFFYKGISEDGLFVFYSEVVERVADPRLAIYLYHIPALSGVPITLALIERLLKRYPTAIVGAKDSSGDWTNTKAMIDNFASDGFAVFPASESFLLEALRIGGAGCISATANINPSGIRALYSGYKTSQAEMLQSRATSIRQIFQPLPMIAAMKATLAHWRHDPSWSHLRPPLTTLPPTVTERLLDQVSAAGIDMSGMRV